MTKLIHGTAYNPELWPEADVERDIAAMKSIGLNLVRMGDFAWSSIEPDEGRISLDFFGRVMDRLHAAGIGVVFCTPTASPPVWLTHGHPERCFVDAEDRVMSHGARQHVSYENPDVRAACFRIVEALARGLGGHPALVAWQIDNEFKCHVAEDFNSSAIAHWHRWLEKRHGTIAKLNEAWGTQAWSQHYQRFDQVPAPRRAPFLHNASLSTAYRMFSRESIAGFMDEQCAILRRHSAPPITHNFSPGFSVNLERMSAGLDFVSFDDYPDRSQWNSLVFDHDLFRAAIPRRPHWLMETSVSHNGWLGRHETAHPPGFLVAEAVSSYALGAGAFCYWPWRQPRTGCELPHSAIMSAWFRPSVGHAQVLAVEAARRQLEPLLADNHPAPAEVAVTWSDLGRAMLQTEPLGANRTHEVDYNRTLQFWHQLLLDAGLHREVRFEGAPLAGLKLLVTPAMPYASPEFLARVEKFVRDGGVWICAPVTGTRGAEHTVPLESGLGEIDALAGVETVFSFPVTGTDAAGEAFGLRAPLAGWCSALRPSSPETKVMGKLHSALAPGLAFLTERSLGRGALVVLGALPEGPDGRRLLDQLILHYATRAGVIRRFDSSPGTVVCPWESHERAPHNSPAMENLEGPSPDGPRSKVQVTARTVGRPSLQETQSPDRRLRDGRTLWVVVNLDGRGGHVTLPQVVTDAISGDSVGPGRIDLGAHEWRVLGF